MIDIAVQTGDVISKLFPQRRLVHHLDKVVRWHTRGEPLGNDGDNEPRQTDPKKVTRYEEIGPYAE